MTTLQIDTNDQSVINEFINLAKQKFNFKVKVVDNTNEAKSLKSQTKWSEFADKMDGLFTPDIVEHINHSREEAREN